MVSGISDSRSRRDEMEIELTNGNENKKWEETRQQKWMNEWMND